MNKNKKMINPFLYACRGKKKCVKRKMATVSERDKNPEFLLAMRNKHSCIVLDKLEYIPNSRNYVVTAANPAGRLAARGRGTPLSTSSLARIMKMDRHAVQKRIDASEVRSNMLWEAHRDIIMENLKKDFFLEKIEESITHTGVSKQLETQRKPTYTDIDGFTHLVETPDEIALKSTLKRLLGVRKDKEAWNSVLAHIEKFPDEENQAARIFETAMNIDIITRDDDLKRRKRESWLSVWRAKVSLGEVDQFDRSKELQIMERKWNEERLAKFDQVLQDRLARAKEGSVRPRRRIVKPVHADTFEDAQIRDLQEDITKITYILRRYGVHKKPRVIEYLPTKKLQIGALKEERNALDLELSRAKKATRYGEENAARALKLITSVWKLEKDVDGLADKLKSYKVDESRAANDLDDMEHLGKPRIEDLYIRKHRLEAYKRKLQKKLAVMKRSGKQRSIEFSSLLV